jgi:hypothetical protein
MSKLQQCIAMENKMNFIDYLISIAPSEETVLFVKQIPKPDLFHKDGAQQCAWPAYLPSKYDGKGAWYCNTASFIIKRFKDKPSASATNCELVAFLVLDDVGTKSKTPDLEPTWIMETSPGNFQYGYTFSLEDQPTKGNFSAAIKSIASAGYTDGGAINAVRNFRLPNSVNHKPDRGGFLSRLVSFNPEREFTLPQICDALGVTPAEADTSTVKRIDLLDDGTDDVLTWLVGRGDVIEGANGEGWVGVTCINAGAHSDGNPMARYHPVNRSYMCFHESCQHLDSKTYLEWVQAEGGPKHTHGLREELLASVMNDTLAKLEPSDMFTNDAITAIAEVDRKELGRLEKKDWFNRFAYIQVDESYFDLVARREVSRATFNALFRHVECKSIHSGRKIEASICYDENRQAMGAHALVGITYAAGDTMLTALDGDMYGNRWRDARPDVSGKAGNVTRWLDHCKTLVPNEAELAHIFNVMAYKVQHPNVKINHAILHGGDQGAGKDTMYAPFIWAVCGPHLKNRGLVDNDGIASQFGYALESEILIINELKEPDAKERRSLANKLKPVIAAPPETLTINRKGLHPYDMVNRIFVLAFSNDPVPIQLESQDRRWFCVWSHAPRMCPEEARSMWDWFKGGGYEAIASWLLVRDVSAFNPGATPMMTEFKLNLVEQGMSTAESYLVDLMRLRVGEFASGVIASPFHALCDRLANSAPGNVKVPQAALLHALKEAGWNDNGRLKSTDFPSQKHIYTAPNDEAINALSKSDLRRMVEPDRNRKLTLVN